MAFLNRTRLGAAAISACMLVLWLVLGGKPDPADLVAGIAVSAAVGIWASIIDM